jgi:hypothetical protein
MYPKPQARREALRLCLETVFDGLLQIERAGEKHQALAREILENIVRTTEENLKINAFEVSDALRRAISSAALTTSSKSAVVLLASELHSVSEFSDFAERSDRHSRFWANETEVLTAQIKTETEALAEIDVDVAVLSWWRKEKTSVEIVRKFGLTAISTSVGCEITGWAYVPILSFLVTQPFSRPALGDPDEIGDARKRRIDWLDEEARTLGELLSKCDLRISMNKPRRSMSFDGGVAQLNHLDPRKTKWPEDTSVAGGVLVCLAVLAEFDSTHFRKQENRSAVAHDLRAFINSRKSPEFRAEASAIIEKRCAPGVVMERLLGWTRGEFSFTRSIDQL